LASSNIFTRAIIIIITYQRQIIGGLEHLAVEGGGSDLGVGRLNKIQFKRNQSVRRKNFVLKN
jgi:hypothetical protein